MYGKVPHLAAEGHMLEMSRTRSAGLVLSVDERKAASIRAIRSAALRLFAERGYIAVSVGDIAEFAGVTRRTFYRHYLSKATLALALFDEHALETERILCSLSLEDCQDTAAVRLWIDSLFDHHLRNPTIRAFTEFSFTDSQMQERIRDHGARLVAALGQRIPAFAFEGAPHHDHRFTRACLLMYQILNQSTLHGGGMTHAPRDLLVDLLSENFQDYTRSMNDRDPRGRGQ
jgi:AcrR family transcriptional regulator